MRPTAPSAALRVGVRLAPSARPARARLLRGRRWPEATFGKAREAAGPAAGQSPPPGERAAGKMGAKTPKTPPPPPSEQILLLQSSNLQRRLQGGRRSLRLNL